MRISPSHIINQLCCDRPDRERAIVAFDANAKLADAVRLALRLQLASLDTSVRLNALRAIAGLGSRAVDLIDDVTPLAKDEDSKVRYQVSVVMRKTGAPIQQCLDALKELTVDPVRFVQSSAREAIETLSTYHDI